MINRLIYAATALALLCVVVFDGNFAADLSQAIGEPIAAMPLNSWERWLAVVFVVLACVALVRELRRPR
jgi:hypothetical protein